MTTTEKEPTNVWEHTESAPAWCSDIAHLWSWSLNYNSNDPRNPYPLFLDIVGYSLDKFGERISGFIATPDQLRRTGYDSDSVSLGWVECDLLAKALSEYSDRPHDCEAWLDRLHELEVNGDN